jgi:PTS system nitrogen regulatory IIA component
MHLGALTKPDLVFVGLPGSDRPTVLKAMADGLAARSVLPDAEVLYERLLEREALGSTGIGGGVAIPHCKMGNLDQVLMAIGICRRGVDFAADDQQPVRLLFLVVSPEDEPAEHLRSLSAISKWVKSRRRVEEILEMNDAEEIYQLLKTEEE